MCLSRSHVPPNNIRISIFIAFLRNKIGKVYSLEHSEITRAFFMPHKQKNIDISMATSGVTN
jgi:hypothetical protein